MSSSEIENRIDSCYRVYIVYSQIIESYVLDYFTQEHWNKLPKSWMEFLASVSTTELVNLLQYKEPNERKVWPLSLLSLLKCLKLLCLPRHLECLKVVQEATFENDTKLLKSFWKNIKLKKRHEISHIAKMCYQNAVETDCFFIVDIGSGLGHLSRLLTYGYEFRVCAIEAQNQLCIQARNLDKTFENVLSMKEKYRKIYDRTIHLNRRIESSITASEFLNIVSDAFHVENRKSLRFGIVGLHPCGDLGPTLLKLYNMCPNIVYINIVGCCYMKLTTSLTNNQWCPLSRFSKIHDYKLTYSSLEVACHAIENYVDKLVEGEHWKLKIHAYRALLEKLIISLKPELHHSPLSNVKYTPDLTFVMYCQKALSKIDLFIPDSLVSSEKEALKEWFKVVVFYTVRLSLAPLVETIVLLDRLMFAQEEESICKIIPIFDPRISPRNQVLSCIKKNSKNTLN